MPVYYDTGLGWEADGSSIVLTQGAFGNITDTSVQPVSLPFFNYVPSASQIVAGGASFYYSGVKYWYAFYNTNSHSPDLKTCIVQNANGNGDIYIVADYWGATTGRNYNVIVTNGNAVWSRTTLAERKTTDQDSASGLYYSATTSFPQIASSVFPWNTPGYSSDTVIVDGPSITNTLSHFVSPPTRFYKLNDGASASGFVRWINTNGEERVSPFQISSIESYTAFSYDNQTPAEDEVTIGMLKDGIHFKMSFFAQYTGQVSDNVTPIYDITDDYPGGIGIGGVMEKLMELTYIRVIDSPDPYTGENGGSSEAGGDGDADPEDNPVEEETLPLPSVAGLGFCTIYVPTDTDLMNLAAYLWGGNLDLDTFLKLFANPMDSILGLSVVPVSLSGTYSPVYMGGQLLNNVTMPKYSGRTSLKVDMGTTFIDERWGSYLDYDPYTELSLYLPFIGIKNIKADDVMGKTISLMYSIDILSGACIAYIRPSGGSVLYEWSGQCALQVPVTGQNWDNIFATAATTAAAIGGALFAPSAVSAGAIASTAVQAIAAKPRVERSGAVNGITGFLGQLRPYLIRVIPEAYIPNDQNKFIGYPSYITANLANLSGYNEISSIHLEGIPATGNELAEIETLLKGGVIF